MFLHNNILINLYKALVLSNKGKLNRLYLNCNLGGVMWLYMQLTIFCVNLSFVIITKLLQPNFNQSASYVYIYIKHATTKAEILHTNFIIQHNMLFLTADHMTHLYPKMFPDSKIANQFACSRTKTSCILNDAMMPNLHDYIVSYMKEQPYSLVNDGSSDSGVDKMNPVCALIFDVNKSKQVSFKFYDMCVTRGEHCSKAATLFDAIEEKLLKEGVSWENCISMRLDNTNSNVGEHNSVKSRVLKRNPNCFIPG